MSEARYTRKSFFRKSFLSVADSLSAVWDTTIAAGAGEAERSSSALIRPPGSPTEAAFLTACTRCDACILACPEHAIRKAGPELGASIAGTPLLLPAENPCAACPDLPCVAACEPGALLRPPGSFQIGLAVVDATLCFSASGQPCDYCVRYCPAEPKPIRLAGTGEAPVVSADPCTGCGQCAHLCPAKAIRIEPA